MANDKRLISPSDEWLTDATTGAIVGVLNKVGSAAPESLFVIPTVAALSTTFDIRTYGAKSNGKQLKDVGTNFSATPTITSASAAFTIADVGKSCVLIENTNTGFTCYGTITSYISATQVVATINQSTSGGLVNAEFIYGTDDTVAINAAFTAASASYPRGTVYIPTGISIFTSVLTTPTGVNLLGAGNTPTAGLAQSNRWTGSTLVWIGNNGGTGITFGNTNSNNIGISVVGINFDFTNKIANGIQGSDWEIHFERCTIARAYSITLQLTGSMVCSNSSIYCQQNGTPVKLNPSDVRIVNCYIYGAQTNLPLLEASGHDALITNCHFFRSPDATGALGDAILVSNNWGAGINRGLLSISNNVFDTQSGSCVNINITNNSTTQSVSIIGNVAFQNDSQANNLYSYIKVNIATGCALRALSITGNVGQGSWVSGSTLGVWKSFIDGAGIVGNLYGSTVTGNALDNCNVLYTTFTPSYTAGNITLAGQGTVVAVG